MRDPDVIFGRLGNRLFQMAFLYTYAKENSIDIFFQNPKYFEKYANEIKALYGDITWTGADFYKIEGVEPVSLHVRLGDYSGNSFYTNLLETDYYDRAMAKFPDRKFLIFSDDVEFCKKQEIFKNCFFSQGKTELEDMNLMSRCNGHIVANSTFSFWGAYLGKGLTVCPDETRYYADGIIRTVFPSFWTRL